MRAIAVVFLGLVACAKASTVPLAPEAGAFSAPEPAHRNKVARTQQPEPQRPRPVVPEPAPAAPEARSEPVDEVASARGIRAGAAVQVIKAGAEPRAALRYVYHQGDSSPFRMRMSMVMDSQVTAAALSSTEAPRTIHQILPSVEYNGLTRTLSVDADGTAHRSGEISGFSVIARQGVQPQVQAKMEELLRGVGRIPFEDVVDTRGQITDSHMDLSGVHEKTMLDSMQQVADGMSALSTPFPADPVGVGAKWKVMSNYGKNKKFARELELTLESRKGNKLELAVKISVTGTPGSEVRNGVTINIGPTSTTGTGKLEIALDPPGTRSATTTHTKTQSSTQGVDFQSDLEVETELESGH